MSKQSIDDRNTERAVLEERIKKDTNIPIHNINSGVATKKNVPVKNTPGSPSFCSANMPSSMSCVTTSCSRHTKMKSIIDCFSEGRSGTTLKS